jgi:GntR family transcriptional regulator
VDPSSVIPIYAQVVEQIRSLVASRVLRSGDKLPSVRELAATLRINRNTAAKAYALLESEGAIQTRAGHGCFVSETSRRWSREERIRRLERHLDRALVEAFHLEFPLDEVPGLLERRIRRFLGTKTTGAR